MEMELEVIMKAGLTEPQAKTYMALLKHGAMTPSQIAAKTGETRTNTYALLDKLSTLKLVQTTEGKKTTYEAAHPSNLEILAEKRRRVLSKNEQVVKSNLSILTDIFYANSNRPGTKTFVGEEGIKEIYQDVARTGEDHYYLLRSTADQGIFPQLKKYRDHLVDKGIKIIALTPATAKAKRYAKDGTDQRRNMDRVLIPLDAYTGTVTVMIYGDKVAMVDYSQTAVSTIITSPAIAEMMRQTFDLLRDAYRTHELNQ